MAVAVAVNVAVYMMDMMITKKKRKKRSKVPWHVSYIRPTPGQPASMLGRGLYVGECVCVSVSVRESTCFHIASAKRRVVWPGLRYKDNHHPIPPIT